MDANLTRRNFLATTSAAGAGLMATTAFGSSPDYVPRTQPATSCIFIWLGGGACQVDTWDPKRVGDAKAKKPGSYYPAIDTAIAGAQLCKPLPRMAAMLDRCVLLRSVHHDVVDEHAAATNRLHTGRAPTGTTLYPSVGSIVSHQIGNQQEEVPSYVVMGYPSASRGPGFLGAQHGYVYLTDTANGPAGLRLPHGVDANRQARREQLLAQFRDRFAEKSSKERLVQDYVESSRKGFRLAGPKFMSVFRLDQEPDSLRQSYGEEFGQRCLLARRLVQAGVSFIEVSFNLNFINGTGWDTHREGQLKQHLLIEQLDQALSSLILDLEKRKLLDRTLIVVGTEFGRPPEFDAGGGRGHQSTAFSILMAGGGLKTGQVIGATDELGKKIIERPVSVADMHATIHHSMGINPAEELYDDVRPVPITDNGKYVSELF